VKLGSFLFLLVLVSNQAGQVSLYFVCLCIRSLPACASIALLYFRSFISLSCLFLLVLVSDQAGQPCHILICPSFLFLFCSACAGYPTKQVKFHCILSPYPFCSCLCQYCFVVFSFIFIFLSCLFLLVSVSDHAGQPCHILICPSLLFLFCSACAGYPNKQVKFHCILLVSVSVLFLLVPVLLSCIFVCIFPCLVCSCLSVSDQVGQFCC